MTLLLKILLSLHVVFGLIGVMGSYAAWMHLLGRWFNPKWLTGVSATAVIGYLLSWFTGGFYYTTYYGTAVKPIIKAGPYPWAHAVFMEAKEHVFLFLPFLAVVLLIGVALSKSILNTNPKFKSAFAWLAGTSAWLGALVAISGVIISGSVR